MASTSALPAAGRRVDVPFAIPGALLVAAGAAGGLAQCALGEALETALGSTGPALTAAVLAVLAGTGLGATLARAAPLRRARPLLLGGALLVALAAAELAVLRAWSALAHAPMAARALVAAPLLLLPSLATGALVPIFARGARRDARGSRRVSSSFALALGGAALGAALAAAALPARGANVTARAAAILSAIAGAVAVALAARWGGDSPAPARPSERAPGPAELAVGAASHGALAGAALAVMGHLARVTTGGAADALAAWLAGIFAGLAFGAVQARALRRRPRDAAATRALGASGVVLAATIPAWGASPWATAVGASFLRAPSELATLHMAVALVTCALPAAWIGASFQLLVPYFGEDAIARGSARAAGAGAAGAALGAALASLTLVPWVGSRGTLAAVAVGFTTLALALAWRTRARTGAAASVVVALALVALAPRWDAARFAYGARPPGAVVWTRESVGSGAAGATADALAANGRTMALDEPTRRAALLAALYAPRLEHAAAIDDLAAGAALLAAPWAHVAIPYVSARWTAHVPAPLRPALDDARAVRLDARGEDALIRARGAYDAALVTLRPACAQGCARPLFARARDALAPDGVALVVLRAPEPAALAGAADAARAVFPAVALAPLGDRAVLLASSAPLAVPPGRLDALHAPDAADALAAVVADDALAACIASVRARRDASSATLRACAGGATARPALVSR